MGEIGHLILREAVVGQAVEQVVSVEPLELTAELAAQGNTITFGDTGNLLGTHGSDGNGIRKEIVDFQPRILLRLPAEDMIECGPPTQWNPREGSYSSRCIRTHGNLPSDIA